MAKHKLIVKRLPKKICISIRAPAGKTLTKKKYVRGVRKAAVKRRKVSRKKKSVGKIKLCARKRDLIVCRRLASKKCLTRKGTLVKSKMCRSLARTRGLKKRTYRKRKGRALSSVGNFFGQTFEQLGLPAL